MNDVLHLGFLINKISLAILLPGFFYPALLILGCAIGALGTLTIMASPLFRED